MPSEERGDHYRLTLDIQRSNKTPQRFYQTGMNSMLVKEIILCNSDLEKLDVNKCIIIKTQVSRLTNTRSHTVNSRRSIHFSESTSLDTTDQANYKFNSLFNCLSLSLLRFPPDPATTSAFQPKPTTGISPPPTGTSSKGPPTGGH